MLFNQFNNREELLKMFIPPDMLAQQKKTKRYWSILNELKNPKTTWCTPNNIIYEHQTLRLRHFPNRDDTTARRPVLILPPQAGHHSNLADYSPAQSLVRVFHRYGYDVYVTQWLSATPEYKNLGISDYIRLTDEAVEEVRRRTGIFKIHLVGQCQGGWQATIYTCLYQDKIATLIKAAAPIDMQAAPSPIVDDAQLPMSFFEYLVARGNGLMDGKYILMGFKNMQAEEHYVRKYQRLWKWIQEDDEDNIKRFIRFENWYEYTQMLPGKFYLEIIKNIFKENNLTKPGAMKIDGKPVDLRNINCPVIIMAGAKDHITPPPQAFALKNYISTPEENVIEILTEGGHIGTLMGTESLREDWSRVNEVLKLVI
ncbi:Polyhydroxyalkanoic acid synthase [Candidatus Syntrophocurvum alkaliphilum]|uniref:Polyhydroxyalkanoic acid synthase n=1 Tax=Candidatus Syntrophocurvum alkaliphilum TaxID=2293317 RepID=A0A6I6DBT0_9FIRM|nr:alpha/beta fold hydrolase [Candidatus Syntrophocurvum alkaliphilum]QGT98640.1 Polyhydroxyalkanoic acid synthase [Candidatus Syntrophocurvum alkaliphilum]